MNVGARYARGNYLWFVHADSTIDFDFETIIETALQNRNWGWFDVRLDNQKLIFLKNVVMVFQKFLLLTKKFLKI